MNDAQQQARFREHEEDNTRQRAAILGMQYFDTRGVNPNGPLATGVLTTDEMYQGHLVPLQTASDTSPLLFGITTNTPQSLLRQLRERFLEQGQNVEFVLISSQGLREFMLRFDPPKEVVYEDVKIAKEGDSDTLEEVSKTLETVRTDDILTYLIEQADKLRASDIHLENQRQEIRVRLRIDGALHPIATISHDKYRILQASIATKANISTATKEPQTGHMQHEFTNDEGKSRLLNMRIETIPTVYGQDAVVRLFNFDSTLLNLDNLGLVGYEREQIENIISHPHGLAMVVGPTGSGKSTTLYSILNALNKTTIKILTLEDPVELSLPGISQIPVSTGDGDSFADKLRAVMRLDPDIIMVGEIRDVDTAKTAIQASITGHLVLSTFHADTAAAAFSRIIDMIGQNPIFSSAIRLVIGQRLVRRLDDQTKTEYDPDEATKAWIRETLKDLPERVDKPNLDNIRLWQPGSSEAAPFGYVGRMLIMEQMPIDERIHGLIRGSVGDINQDAIEKAAIESGMVTLLQNGVLSALRGDTTLEEIHRVI
jgi:type II secretory ATPase GspE/PulE/Tfp pilus assembly ATPase PilB-like protein